jgi:polyisoprenoid-binding protein YceI
MKGSRMSVEHWEIADISGIEFTVPHFLISKVRGRFNRWTGSVLVPDGDWARATVDVAIDASSIDTGIAERDEHLRTAHFLDVGRYPDITFRSLHVAAGAAGGIRLIGELTMKGRVGEVPLEVERGGVTLDQWGQEHAHFSARGAIRRRDFGVSGNLAWDRYGVIIGERVDIEVGVEAVRQPEAAISFLSGVHDVAVAEG